jgi:tRNA(Ile)-lysidine synthase
MSKASTLLGHIRQSWPLEDWHGAEIVIAVSGGMDSVAILRALHSLAASPNRLHVAHFNHGWRGEESDADERFVVELCQSLNVHCVTQKAPLENEARTEQNARKARYRFLREVSKSCSSQFIVTAHTASDRVETMLHNLCRGTGLAGVCTPTIFRKLDNGTTLVRPLINCFREDVLEYLSSIGQTFRHDSSNDNQRYRRNFLRNSVLPMLRQAYGKSVDQRLLSFSQLAEQSLHVQQEVAASYWANCRSLEQEKIAQGWLPPCRQSEIRFPGASLISIDWQVALIALQQAWHKNHWPLQSLTRLHWQKLRSVWETLQEPQKQRPRNPRSLFQLPGKIDVRSLHGWIIIATTDKVNATIQ